MSQTAAILLVLRHSPALALYDIDRIYVGQSCLETRGLAKDLLALEADILSDEAVSQLFHQHQHILSF